MKNSKLIEALNNCVPIAIIVRMPVWTATTSK